MTKVLMVCLGNICRSPSAEAILKKKLTQRPALSHVKVDSCGVIGFHAGKPADNRMMAHASRRGYELTSLSRQITAKDFEQFDHILCMDQRNYIDLQELSLSFHQKDQFKKVKLICDYCETFESKKEVPDPYYGGAEGFELVLDILEDATNGFIKAELEDK